MATVDTDLEDLMSHMGEFGKYQGCQYSLHVLAGLLAGLHMLTLLTVASVPDHKCVVPGLKPKLGETLTWHNVPGPSSQLGNFTVKDSCYYVNANDDVFQCDNWVYDETYYSRSSFIESYFICSGEWRGAVAQCSYMLGVFAGAALLGSLADKYGRKIIFCISATAQLVLGVLVAFIPEYYSFLVVRFLYGIFGSAGAYITGFVLTMEMVGPSKRTVCGMMFQLAFACGFCVLAFWGFFITNRTWLQVIYGLHSCLLIPHWWLMDESPRWLWAQGRAKEAVTIVQKALRINGESIQLDMAKYVSKNRAKQSAREGETSYGAIDLFRTPNLRKKSLNVCLNWFANAIVYYGLSLSSGSLPGNKYLMLAVSGLVEVPSYIFACFTMDKLGRRSLVSSFMLIGGFCCIGATLFPSDISGGAKTAVIMLGKSCIAISFAVIYNYTAELFPTVLRNTALGIGSMCCRLSGALTPLMMLLNNLDPRIPAISFGIIALVSGFLSLYLPETSGHPMPETLEDGENFGRGDTCFTTCLGRRKVSDFSMKPVDGKESEKTNETE